MKLLILCSVIFLSLSFFSPTQSVTLEIDGAPKCLKNGESYTIRVIPPGELNENEEFHLTGAGILLFRMTGYYVYKGSVGKTQKQVILSVSIYNKKTKTSEQVLTDKIDVCN